MNIIEILKQLVVSMRADSSVFAALWNRIYIWQPKSETQTGNYMTINIIWQTQNIEVNNRTRVEFRFIWKDNTIDIDTLSWIETTVTNFIKWKTNDLWFYKYELGTYANWYDEKKTPILVRDFVFYHTT